jgi:hypothetical protein
MILTLKEQVYDKKQTGINKDYKLSERVYSGSRCMGTRELIQTFAGENFHTGI